MFLLKLINDMPFYIKPISLILGLVYQSPFFLLLFLANFFGLFINKFNKEILFKTIYSIYGKKTPEGIYLPILGIGNRPLGATCCDDLFNCKDKLSKSFGMPSGHAQVIGILTAMVLLFWFNKNKKGKILERIMKLINEKWEWLLILILLIIGIFYTRIFYTNCHTFQQVIIGFMIGLGIGYFTFDIYKKMGETFFLRDKII